MSTPEIILSISTVLISVLALGLTIWQGYTTRKHNVLCVTPMLKFQLDQANKFQFNLKNTGVGPAIICDFKIKFDGEIVSDNPSPIKDPYPDIFKNLGIGGFKYEMHIPGKNSSYSVNEQHRLLSIDFIEEQINGREQFKLQVLEILKKIEFEVSYQSLYKGVTFTENSTHDT
jgi:hypothetical protein